VLNSNLPFYGKDVSSKYRIKQNNDYPANKPSFHAVFQDAAQPVPRKNSSELESLTNFNMIVNLVS